METRAVGRQDRLARQTVVGATMIIGWWAIVGPCPLYPRKLTCAVQTVMSALGQKRTFAMQKVMSALPPRANMCGATRDVRFGPIADMSRSLDDHVGSLQEDLRNCQTKRLGRLEINDKFKFGGLLNWHVRGQSTLQYFGYKPCTLPKRSRTIGAIRQHAAGFSKRSRNCSRRQAVPYRQIRDGLRR